MASRDAASERVDRKSIGIGDQSASNRSLAVKGSHARLDHGHICLVCTLHNAVYVARHSRDGFLLASSTCAVERVCRVQLALQGLIE